MILISQLLFARLSLSPNKSTLKVSSPAMSPEKEQEQVTLMILNVDLKCSCCYKKVRKLLCEFPQIRDQVFDEEKNQVRITVVCCDPEKLRDKLCCKGGGAIQSIEIPPPKPPTPPPPVSKPKTDPDPPKKDPITHTQPPTTPVPEPVTTKPPVSVCCQECYEGRGGGPCYYGYGRPPPGPCYGYGRPTPPPPGPCYGYGRPTPPPPGPCYGYGYQYRPPCSCRCDYLSEENPQGCSIM